MIETSAVSKIFYRSRFKKILQILVDATSHRGRLLTYLLPVIAVAVLLNIPKVVQCSSYLLHLHSCLVLKACHTKGCLFILSTSSSSFIMCLFLESILIQIPNVILHSMYSISICIGYCKVNNSSFLFVSNPFRPSPT